MFSWCNSCVGRLHSPHSAQVALEWGARLEEQPAALSWCVLASGTHHTLSPVTAGHRITLTYSIFAGPAAPALVTGINITATRFACVLKTALQSEAFLPEGSASGAWEHTITATRPSRRQT